MKTKLILSLAFIFSMINSSFGQSDSVIEQTFHESGKINVVIAVVAVIFIGIVFYLIRLERKLSKMENENQS